MGNGGEQGVRRERSRSQEEVMNDGMGGNVVGKEGKGKGEEIKSQRAKNERMKGESEGKSSKGIEKGIWTSMKKGCEAIRTIFSRECMSTEKKSGCVINL